MIDKHELAGSIALQIDAGRDIPVTLEYPEEDIPPAIAVVSVDSITHVNTGDSGTFRVEVSITSLTRAADDLNGEILSGMAATVASRVTDLALADLIPVPVGKAGNETTFEEAAEYRRAVTRFSLFFSL